MKHSPFFPVYGYIKIYVFFLTIILLSVSSGCRSDKEIDQKSEPNLVIIGEDLSGTFDQFPETTEEDLRNLCKVLETTRDGGKVYFIGIGSSTPKGYAYCTIRPKKVVDRKDPPYLQQKAKIYNKKLERINIQQVDAFISNASTIFQQRNQKYTDINGFFEKVASILSTPTHKSFKKWLYVNSDGKQATLSSSQVNCDLRPTVHAYFVNRGWKNANDCGAAEKLLDTQHFVEYFRTEMEVQSIADQNK